MTNKAINPFFIVEIKLGILPAITGMTAGAPAPVGGDSYSEVVNHIFFPKFPVS